VTSWNVIQFPLLRAAVELKRGDPAQAIELLQALTPHELWAPPITYLLGLAYLRVGKGSEAESEFQKLVDHKGIHGQFEGQFPGDTGPLRALSYGGLARAAVLAGDRAKARTAYQDFFALWKDADPDLPVLLEARKEYAALK
jgi:eukaryotic-like serine/threonine-protein kinase